MPTYQPNKSATLLSSKTLTTNISNTTASTALFRITGVVEVKALYGIVTTVLSSAHTVAHFRLNDQTAQIQITAVGGTTLSNAAVGSMIFKSGLAAAAVALKDAVVGFFVEPTTLETLEYSEFTVGKKSGANTDIEYTYTTTNTPATGAIQFFLEWIPRSADASVTPQ